MSVLHSKPDRILVIDDDPSMVALVQSLADLSNTNVVAAGSLREGMRQAREHRFDTILLDHRLPDGNGLDHIDELMQQDRMRPVLYITAQSGSQTAIEAMKRGAFDYLTKPFDFGLLKQRLAEALEYRKLTRIPVMVDAAGGRSPESDVLVGRCRAMQEVYKGIGRFAAMSGPVLIEGEVGTGKEMIARTIHNHGSRTAKNFLKVSTEDESGATSNDELMTIGSNDRVEVGKRIRDCEGGTLMIEEIGGLSLPMQSRVLKFLQQGELDIRVIFSTSTPSRELMQRGSLRSDLFYFLSPFAVRVPALRDRIDDFELLVSHFMQTLLRVSSAVQNEGPPRVSPAAMNLLRAYDWPGNVAQLKSVLQSVLVESRGAVLATDALRRALDTRDRPAIGGGALPTTESKLTLDAAWDLAAFVRQQLDEGTDHLYETAIHRLDQQLLTLVLQHTQGNQAQAARMLGMTRTSLRRKIAASHIKLADLGPALGSQLLDQSEDDASDFGHNQSDESSR